MSDQTTDIKEFTVSIKWHAPGKPDEQRVFARNAEDAAAIARLIFQRGHTDVCVIDNIEVR